MSRCRCGHGVKAHRQHGFCTAEDCTCTTYEPKANNDDDDAEADDSQWDDNDVGPDDYTNTDGN